MSEKQRRLSPTLASESITTPELSSYSLPSVSSSLSTLPVDHHSSPPPPVDQESTDLAVPESSRASHRSTPLPVQAGEVQALAKHAAVVPGSGDGPGHGDECFLWMDLAINKQGFRYLACGPSPNPSPFPLYAFFRTLPGPPPCPPVHVSWLDRSSFLRLSNNALTVSTDRGFRSGRANVSVREGSWYYEVYIERGHGPSMGILGSKGSGGDAGNPHVRVGWGRREALLDGPVGMDGYGYAMRDVGGEKVHLSRSKAYGRAFGTGDVIGCLITLPPRRYVERGLADPASIMRRRVPFQGKGQRYFEMDEYVGTKEMDALVDREGKGAAAAKAAAEAAKINGHVNGDDVEITSKAKKGAITKNAKKGKTAPAEPTGPLPRDLRILAGSKIEFFLNGDSLGTAFEDVYDYTPLPPLIPLSTPSVKKHGPVHPEPKVEMRHDDGTLGYYPMVSCFGRGKVRLNFGPEWLKPPIDLIARPMSERWAEFREEERVLDEQDEAEATERNLKEMEAEAVRRKVLEAKAAAVKDRKRSVSPKKRPKSASSNVGKKRKSMGQTPTPAPDDRSSARQTPSSTPAPEVVKQEVESVASPRSRATSRAASVKPLDQDHAGEGLVLGPKDTEMDVDADGEDPDEGVKW